MTLITKTAELAEFCDRQRSASYVTVDTEFLRDNTYWPKLCVVQVAGPEEAIAIDAPDYETYVAAIHALDRVMLWNFYFVPSSAKTEQAMVYWDKFGRPEDQVPLVRQPQVPTWWYDEEKAKAVLTYLGEG